MARRHHAFTLIELLVVIAIIALVLGVVIASLRGVKASATRAESLSAVRQMGQGYLSYTAEHRQQLMPGYLDKTTLQDNAITAVLPDGTVLDDCDGNICAASSYVWRLAPYLGNAWHIYYQDLTDEGAISELTADFGKQNYGPGSIGPFAFDGGISERPTYGLNSIFLGGDTTHGGPFAVNSNPWTGGFGKIAATRLSEVKNPARVIVFGPAAKASLNPDEVYGNPEVGFCELRPPYLKLDSGEWVNPQWKVGQVGKFGTVEQTGNGAYGAGAGLPIARAGTDLLPVVHLDGSATVEKIGTLSRDMRHWDPFEVSMRGSANPP